MSLNIKSERAHELARQLATATGETMTDAVTVALRERLDRVQRDATVEQRAARILELAREIGSELPTHGLRAEDLYDPTTGLPA